MLLADLADTSQRVRATSSRTAKLELLAARMRELAPDETPVAVAFLSGELRQRQIGAGWATLRDVPAPAAHPSLSVLDADGAFAAMAVASGAGSQAARRELLHDLFSRATEPEQRLLRGLVTGELRHGAQTGVVAEAVARAAGVPPAALRRALMLGGDLGEVGRTALVEGEAGLNGIRLTVGSPLRPMLAGSANTVAEGLGRLGSAAVEWKLDGARIQVHRDGADVAVFTRTLDDITARVPEVVEAALELPVTSAVLDGEAIALGPEGRPLPFQVTARRIGGRRSVAELRRSIPLTPVLFDLLHLNGADLLDRPGEERFSALSAVVPRPLVVPRMPAVDTEQAEVFMADALDRGHEGVMLKALDQPYQAGRRGSGWLKVKAVKTLDLVVLAAEWGHGRRTGYLSNLHLGARDPQGGFVMLGKTFKGLTDSMLAWQTTALQALETRRDEWTVHVRPELVVEIAFDGVQRSTRYPGGVALRFARVKRYRTDKPAAEADTIDQVRAIHDGSLG
ncbi:MAG: ATP-dependent DNA ligase [Gaiellales bacterium]